MKIEVQCKECGKKFVKYSYSGIARCEECRKTDKGLPAGIPKTASKPAGR